MTELLTNLGDAPDQVMVERAIAEFRNARPVMIKGAYGSVLVIGIEDIGLRQAAYLDALAQGAARLVLPAARLRTLGLDSRKAGYFPLISIDIARIALLAVNPEAKADTPVEAAGEADENALELARLSLVLPAVLVLPLNEQTVIADDVVTIESDLLHKYRKTAMTKARLISRAPVPLDKAGKSEFVVFRGGEGMRDQVAIIVGEPDLSQPVYVRLHSACLTGDLFGSLKCDCGDQLRATVQWMAENEGGILLYLDQEGRGNGIANKIRAYRLQAEGYDTYAADEVLGFDLDQRHFEFAAEMLKQLGVSKVRILTNNPVKIEALQKSGLDVVSDERVLGRLTDENKSYLATKRDKAGHLLDYDSFATCAPRKD
ncbi:GTP cyclohydrolase II RibA [Microvirga sp. W0021]|uniref:GTP cyclohydrolase-2 n=1 Tax=Hohaiivirga grylli TaxID=3133970 RepID=A0ABV0BKK4_9HYPH